MQKLEDFISAMKLELNKFERYWVQHNKKDPSNWPMKSTPDDWLEQFLVWNDMEKP